MKLRFLPAVAILLSLLAPAARGTVLVYEGFHQGDWTGITATGSQQIHKATTTGDYSTGFTAGSKWSMADSTTQILVSGTDDGLSLPAVMTAKEFTTCGGAAQCNPGSNNSQLRGGRHDFASNTLKVSSGTLYVRALLRLTAPAAAKLNSVATPAGNADGSYFGFGLIGSTSSNRYAPTLTSNKSSCSFLMWKNSDGTLVLSLCLIDADGTLSHYPLVTGVTLDSTYLCYAEIEVGSGADDAELVRSGAVDAADFTGAVSWATLDGASDTVEIQLITDSAFPKSMAFTGPYGTNGGSFRADELVVGTEMKDILPVGGVFSVSGTGSPTVATNSFSTAWILVADDGVTADAGLVWSTDETFATATTNSLGTGLVADTRTASLTGLDPDTTYWWKIVADNGTEVAETTPASFTTPGVPVFGTTTATVTGESAAFTVALEEAALVNTLATSVSVFYGTDGENWTELPLGTTAVATTLSGSADSLGYGVTYQWFALATATMEGGRVLSTSTSTNSFTTLWSGDIYVSNGNASAEAPYASWVTAAPDIATAISFATDGATIHVAPGRYTISTPLSLTKAVELVGDNADPALVVVSNTANIAWGNSNHRCILVNHANAWVSGMTFENGKDYGNGGNVRIDTNGGVVTNCILSGGFTREGSDSGGANVAIMGPGLVTHCRILGGDQNNCGGGDRVSSVYLEHANARIENCLVRGFQGSTVSTQPTVGCAGILVNKGAAVNCTVADCTSPYTTASGFAGILVWANGVATNCVSVSNVDSNGTVRAFEPSQVSRTSHCAFDAIAGEAVVPEGMPHAVVGTPEQFFRNYASDDYAIKYQPKTGGPLAEKGANYEPIALYDLSGVQKRKISGHVDIGCYEGNAAATVIIMK